MTISSQMPRPRLVIEQTFSSGCCFGGGVAASSRHARGTPSPASRHSTRPAGTNITGAVLHKMTRPAELEKREEDSHLKQQFMVML